MNQDERWAILKAAVESRSVNAIALIPRNSKGKVERAVFAILRNGDWRRAERYVVEHFNQRNKEKQS